MLDRETCIGESTALKGPRSTHQMNMEGKEQLEFSGKRKGTKTTCNNGCADGIELSFIMKEHMAT